jgi:predicted enzyme related to lactoylglutathione lyase
LKLKFRAESQDKERAMSNPVGWFEIYVRDMPRAKAFYEAVLGRTLHALPQAAGPDSPEMLVFDMNDQTYGAAGALVCMPGFEPGGNSVLVYFSCDDCAVEAAKAAAAGGQIVKPRTSIGPYGYIALVLDTEGNMIGLHSAP